MTNKIDITNIIKDHIHTLRNYKKVIEYEKDPKSIKKYELYSKLDIFVFLMLPLIIGEILFFFEVFPTEGILTTLITSLSIFGALLFNLLLLIYDIMQKFSAEESEKVNKSNNRTKKRLLKELYTNISFSILIAIFTTIIAVFTLMSLNWLIIYLIFSLLVYYLFIIFILTIFMVLKRVYALLNEEI